MLQLTDFVALANLKEAICIERGATRNFQFEFASRLRVRRHIFVVLKSWSNQKFAPTKVETNS